MKLPPSLVPQLGMYPQASALPLANAAAGGEQKLMQPAPPFPPRPRQPRPVSSLASMAAGPRAAMPPTSTY